MPETRQKSGIGALRPGEAYAALAYFAGYLAWLFVHLENERWHWVSLVLLPLGAIYIIRLRRGQHWSACLASVGLQRERLAVGLLWAAGIGLGFCALQFVLGNQGRAALQLFRDGSGWYLAPLAFLLLLATAASTEEVFFRGVLQTRLNWLLRHPALSIGGSALAFGLYHLPYALLSPGWPSHGNLLHALALSFGQGLPVGLVLGLLYHRCRNLLAPILLHALIDTIPAMLVVQRLLMQHGWTD